MLLWGVITSAESSDTILRITNLLKTLQCLSFNHAKACNVVGCINDKCKQLLNASDWAVMEQRPTLLTWNVKSGGEELMKKLSHQWWTITTGTSTIYFTAEDKAVPEQDSELPSRH